jgi:glycosyltransferase involved in cell wall biosynthesis
MATARIAALKRIAGPTIRFTGPASFPELKDYLARCRALIFPGEEDFGIVPVEAMASGRPVIAFGGGGALDTIVPGHTGVLFKEQTVESLADSIELFETMEHRFYPELIQLHAAQFSVANFKAGMKRIIDQALSERHTVVDVKPYGASLSPVFEGVSHAPLH